MHSFNLSLNFTVSSVLPVSSIIWQQWSQRNRLDEAIYSRDHQHHWQYHDPTNKLHYAPPMTGVRALCTRAGCRLTRKYHYFLPIEFQFQSKYLLVISVQVQLKTLVETHSHNQQELMPNEPSTPSTRHQNQKGNTKCDLGCSKCINKLGFSQSLYAWGEAYFRN